MCLVVLSGGSAVRAAGDSDIFLLEGVTWYGRVAGWATGFFTKDGKAWTASHVIAETHQQRARLIAVIQGKKYAVNVLCASRLGAEISKGATQPSRDIAEIQIVGYTSLGGLSVQLTPPVVGEALRVVGFDDPVTKVTYTGHVIGFYPSDDGANLVTLDGMTPLARYPSGAPILDLKGRVVGVLDWIDFTLSRRASGTLVPLTCSWPGQIEGNGSRQ